jgi:hypothetical protein
MWPSHRACHVHAAAVHQADPATLVDINTQRMLRCSSKLDSLAGHIHKEEAELFGDLRSNVDLFKLDVESTIAPRLNFLIGALLEGEVQGPLMERNASVLQE